MPDPEPCLRPARLSKHQRQRRKAHAIGLDPCVELVQGAARERETLRGLARMIQLLPDGERHALKLKCS